MYPPIENYRQLIDSCWKNESVFFASAGSGVSTALEEVGTAKNIWAAETRIDRQKIKKEAIF